MATNTEQKRDPAAGTPADAAAERVNDMSELLERGESLLDSVEEMLLCYENAQPMIAQLAAYYESDDWKADFAADEAGRLSRSVNRGALSEDGIYHLLEKNRALAERMRGFRAEP